MTTPIAPSGDHPIRDLLRKLAGRLDLGEAETAAVVGAMIRGEATQAEMAAVLMALAVKGEAAAEVAGAARALRSAMHHVSHPTPELLVDTCGTGGGTITTLNVSTAAAFVAAGAGVPVAKHGNRSFTSRSGSADVLEAMGVLIGASPERAADILAEVGIAFLFAPNHHPAMRHVAAVRRELGVPTIMNLVGPLANPAGASRQVLGVADAARGPVMAEALVRLGCNRAMVVHGAIGIDEIAPMGRTTVWEVGGTEVTRWEIEPAELGFEIESLDGLQGGEPSDNAAAIIGLFTRPADAPRALAAAVLLNAAAAIRVGTDGMSMPDAVARARESLHEGRAADRLQALQRASALSTSG